jgi:hypothetical protein
MASFNAVKKVEAFLITNPIKKTLAEIRDGSEQLRSQDVSMALNYLLKKERVTRELVKNTNPKGRKSIFLYSYKTK